jgi:hypothetical protein
VSSNEHPWVESENPTKWQVWWHSSVSPRRVTLPAKSFRSMAALRAMGTMIASIKEQARDDSSTEESESSRVERSTRRATRCRPYGVRHYCSVSTASTGKSTLLEEKERCPYPMSTFTSTLSYETSCSPFTSACEESSRICPYAIVCHNGVHINKSTSNDF